MRAAPPHPDEARRLAELRSLDLLDTSAEERFDHVTRLAQRVFGVPYALITLIDGDRQWFTSRQDQGDLPLETPRDVAFCAHTILGEEALVVTDASRDERFEDNPLVAADPSIRFYAGHPIHGPSGLPLGALCVLDVEPRAVTDDDLASLRDLAAVVEKEIAAAHLATVDALTGLSNRRGFDILAGKALEIATRGGTISSLLYLDLGDFKAVNDTLGHAAGDEVLVTVARLLEGVFRGSDIVARLGGDEFVVLLGGDSDTERALARLLEALDRVNAARPPEVRSSVSVGRVDPDPTHPEPVDRLLAAADALRYQAKRSRRR